LVLLLLALGAFLAYLTRACLATANTSIQKDLGFSNEQMGYIFAGFSLGYFWFQVPGAWLGSRLGARLVFPIFAITWSIATVWTGLASAQFSMWCSRLLFGLAQAGLFPCSAKVVKDWMPENRRASSGSIISGRMSLGAVAASGLTALLLSAFGWRFALLLYAAVGFVWAALFYMLFRNHPEEHPWVNRAERALLGPELDASDETKPDRRSLILAAIKNHSIWALCAQSFFRSFGYMFFITWFPAYLERGFGVQLVDAGLLSMVPLASAVTGVLAGGIVVDHLLARTGNYWVSRSASASVALGLCALCTLTAIWARQPLVAVLLVSGGSFLAGIAGAASWAATIDLGGRHTAIVGAVMNMVGVIGDILCPVTLGYLFSYIDNHNGSWNTILYLFAAVYLGGAVCWLALNPKDHIGVARQKGKVAAARP
jgi:sugar phosphate permease